jgi:hypothetical protein
MIFISFGAYSNSYDWSQYTTSKKANFYYDDLNVAKTRYTINSECYDKYELKCNFRKWVQSITLDELISYKQTQTFKNNFRYRSIVNIKTYDCKTYKYYLKKRTYYKDKVVYNSDTANRIRTFISFSDQDRKKLPKLNEGKILKDIVQKLCKSFYPNGAKMFSQKLTKGKEITRADVDNDCAILTSTGAIASDKAKAEINLINRGLMRGDGSGYDCYKVVVLPVEIK